ncbi:DUF6477 family protein [Shimia sp. MMG029]|uniref:DUF6477 family protein n=1 Tax=Shimia sp. MMG029 TaxID=3021978 RepID=UPI0022FDB739|nr:DUF6477 family protein [Shimia sp. MMG029]MDA5556080.1 DUF6477 family protein [Shimia sp. MMG029]
MQGTLSQLATLRRPRLLIRAARAGTQDYTRNQHLKRVLGVTQTPRNLEALTRLMTLEAELNEERRKNAASYSIVRHVDLMIAMMGEAQLLQATHQN